MRGRGILVAVLAAAIENSGVFAFPRRLHFPLAFATEVPLPSRAYSSCLPVRVVLGKGLAETLGGYAYAWF